MAGTANPVDSVEAGNVWLDSILWGSQWDSGAAPGEPTVVTYYVAGTSGPETIVADGRDLTALSPVTEELAAIDAAMASWAAVCAIEFVATDSQAGADVVWVMADNRDAAGALGWDDPPGTAVNGDPAGQSLVVINHETYDPAPGSADALAIGGFDYVTFPHELGHAIGLAHPHDRGGGSGVFPGVDDPFDDYGAFAMNQGLHTVMSYNDGYPDGPLGPSPSQTYGYEGGPMALDIAAAQLMYGANMATATGDDTYRLPGANETGTFYSCIWDAGGRDTMAGTSGDDAIDLRAATLAFGPGGGGFLSASVGVHGGYTIANGAVIEDARGGAGDDRLLGNEAANALAGGDDDDRLAGAAAGDAVDGGAGADQLSGNRGDDAMTGGDGADWMWGGIGQDTFVFAALSDSGPDDPDTIAGFRRGWDAIDLSALGLDASDLDQQATADGVLVTVDADGDGVADMTILLAGRLVPVPESDFLL